MDVSGRLISVERQCALGAHLSTTGSHCRVSERWLYSSLVLRPIWREDLVDGQL